MSILIVGLDEALSDELIPRLVGQGDEVRVLENDQDAAARYRSLGAYIARGDPTDPDLLMRAATGCRSLVLLDAATSGATLTAALEGGDLARVERLILCSPAPDQGAVARLRERSAQYVVLSTRAAGILKRNLPSESVAAALDAADDLGGEPRLELDLRSRDAWRRLGLPVPN